MSRLKYLFFLFLFLLSHRINAQDPNWNSMLIIPPNPSPYISDWENNPNNITYSLQYLGQGSATIILEFSVESDKLGELLSGSSQEIDFVSGPEQRNISGTDLVDWNNTKWNKSIETQAIRTGRFPEGQYTACIGAYDLNENLLTESCINFAISYPDPPYLIAPLSGDSLTSQYPTFQWSPVINTYSTDPIVYSIRIVELLKGQTKEQAMLANYPHYENKIGITALSYPPSAQLFEKNKTYVWQITALDENDVPIASNNGESEIWTFKYIDNTSMQPEITFVNDGVSGDEDYTSSTKQLSANWSEIPDAAKYFYAIGTTSGGTDVVGWTDNGPFYNVTKTGLNLTDGTKYFVSVKAQKSDGSSTKVKTSDGIVVKVSNGLSLLTKIDPSKLNYYYDDIFSSPTSNNHPETANIDFTFNGPTGLVLDINKIKLIWKDENKNLLKDEGFISLDKYTFYPSVIIKPKNSGTTVTFSPIHSANSFFENNIKSYQSDIDLQVNKYILDLANDPNVSASEGQDKIKQWFDNHKKTYKLSIVVQGTYQDKNNVGRSLESDPIDLTIVYHPEAKPGSSFSITSTTNTLSFSPIKTQDKLDLDILLMSGSENELITLDTRTDTWFKNGTLFKAVTQKLAIPVILQTGTAGGLLTAEVNKSVTYLMDTTAQKKFLGKNGQADYTLSIQYSGTDKNGSLIEGKLDKPVPVTFTRSGTMLGVDATPANLFFAINKLSDQLTLKPTLYSKSGTSVKLDELVTHWYKMDNTVYKTVTTTLSKPISLSANQTVTYNTDITFDKQFIQDALNNKDKGAYLLKFELRGKDQNGKIINGITTNSITVNLSTTTVDLKVKITPTEQIFDENNFSHDWNVQLDYKGKELLTIDKLYAVWYDFAGKFVIRKPAETKVLQFKPPSSSENVIINQTITDYERVTVMRRNGNHTIQVGDEYEQESFKMHFEYEGVDNLGRKVVGKSNIVDVGLKEKWYPLKVIASPDNIATADSSVKVKFTIISTLNSDVTLQFRKIRIKKGTELLYRSGYEPTPGFKGGVTDDIIAFGSLDVIPAKGQYVDETYIDINLKEALKNEDSAVCLAEIEYNAKKSNGDVVLGKAYVPINLTKPGKTKNILKPTDLILIPKVAAIRIIESQTIVSSSGSNMTLNGEVKLLFLTSPFKNDSTFVTATNLSFAKDSSGYKVNGGTFFGEAAPGAEEDLFNFKLKNVLKIQVQQLSYNHNRVNKLLIKSAYAKIPVIDKKIFFKDLVINKNGLNLKFSQQELTAFGLVFIVKNFSDTKSSTGNSKLSLGVGLRLNNKKNKPEKKEFFSGELVIQKVKGGETTVELKGANGGGKPLIRLIPTTDYLNFNSFKFVKKPKDNWAMQVGVSSANLPIYSKIDKDPINVFFEYEKSGKMTAKLEFINEKTHGYDKNDKTVFNIGKLAAVDLTYLGFKIEQVQEITIVDSKPDTSWVFDIDKCQIGISADLYLASKEKKL
ncbi:hypothetical protein MNBD_IGNAVI01-351, partial [hydrothermal vent metagenome]